MYIYTYIYIYSFSLYIYLSTFKSLYIYIFIYSHVFISYVHVVGYVEILAKKNQAARFGSAPSLHLPLCCHELTSNIRDSKTRRASWKPGKSEPATRSSRSPSTTRPC